MPLHIIEHYIADLESAINACTDPEACAYFEGELFKYQYLRSRL